MVIIMDEFMEKIKWRQSFEEVPLDEFKVRIYFKDKDIHIDYDLFTKDELEEIEGAELSHFFCVLHKLKKMLNVDGQVLDV